MVADTSQEIQNDLAPVLEEYGMYNVLITLARQIEVDTGPWMDTHEPTEENKWIVDQRISASVILTGVLNYYRGVIE